MRHRSQAARGSWTGRGIRRNRTRYTSAAGRLPRRASTPATKMKVKAFPSAASCQNGHDASENAMSQRSRSSGMASTWSANQGQYPAWTIPTMIQAATGDHTNGPGGWLYSSPRASLSGRLSQSCQSPASGPRRTKYAARPRLRAA